MQEVFTTMKSVLARLASSKMILLQLLPLYTLCITFTRFSMTQYMVQNGLEHGCNHLVLNDILL